MEGDKPEIPEVEFERLLKNIVIKPYSEKMEGFLRDTFNELDLPDKLIKELKDNKRTKKAS